MDHSSSVQNNLNFPLTSAMFKTLYTTKILSELLKTLWNDPFIAEADSVVK